MMQQIRLLNRGAGFTLIEMMVTLALTVTLCAGMAPSLAHVIGASRLEASAQNLVSVLNFARSEALRSGRVVYLCGLHMRRNQKLNGCTGASAEHRWRQGALVFADRPGGFDGDYDQQEDLRDVAFYHSTVLVDARLPVYRILPRGEHDPAHAPCFMLRERLSARVATVRMDPSSAWPVQCRGDACPACRS
jgi:type IV fimbrial biogenesis protein FimT